MVGEPEIIGINLQAIHNVAGRGVRRAALFLGLGINAANNPQLKDYLLERDSPLRFFPKEVDDKTLTTFKYEFSEWIVSCGFRELIETFTIYLDGIYRACTFFSSSGKPINGSKINKKIKDFQHSGLETKITTLNKEFTVGMKYPDFLLTISRARNCFTHRLGLVGGEDCTDDSKLTVKWMGIDIYVSNPSGEVPLPHPIPPEGILWEKDGKMLFKAVERTLTFAEGTLISFSPRELLEICAFVSQSIDDVVKAVNVFLEITKSKPPY